MARQRFRKYDGFTLIELITVIVVLGIVSVGISGFIKTGVDIYSDATERDQVLGESRFLVERLNRELRLAIPNSARVSTNFAGTIQCLEFVPAEWVTYYTTLPVMPDTSTTATVIEIADNSGGFELMPPVAGPFPLGDFAIVYPTSNDDVYNLVNGKRKLISACTDDGDGDCTTADDSGRTADLTVASAFADDSPASRLYVARQAISYCMRDANIYRHESLILTGQPVYSTGGVLMAENLKNDLSDSAQLPFRVSEATLSRNSLVHILFAFERNEEVINYSSEVHIPNVP